MVLMELPDIIDAIIAKEPPAVICAQVKICANTSAKAVAAPKDSGICNMCQLVVTQVGMFKKPLIYVINQNII